MKMAYPWLLLAVMTLWLGEAQAAGVLAPHTAQYKVKISVVSGRLSTELRATKDGYVATHVIKATGLSGLFFGGTMDVTSEFASASDGVEHFRGLRRLC